MSQSPSRFVFSNVIVDVSISCRSFVFSRSRAKVSAGFTNVNSLAVAAFDIYTAPCLSSGLALSLKFVISRRKKVIGLCATRIL